MNAVCFYPCEGQSFASKKPNTYTFAGWAR